MCVCVCVRERECLYERNSETETETETVRKPARELLLSSLTCSRRVRGDPRYCWSAMRSGFCLGRSDAMAVARAYASVASCTLRRVLQVAGRVSGEKKGGLIVGKGEG